jgi:hypothetical protein
LLLCLFGRYPNWIRPWPNIYLCPANRAHVALKHDNHITKSSLRITIHAHGDVAGPLDALVLLERLQAEPAPVEPLSNTLHMVWTLQSAKQVLQRLLEELGHLQKLEDIWLL